MMKDPVKDSVKGFARDHGYQTAEYIGEWRGFTCYEPIFKEGEVAYIGLPILILEDEKGNLRMSTLKECLQQIDESLWNKK